MLTPSRIQTADPSNRMHVLYHRATTTAPLPSVSFEPNAPIPSYEILVHLLPDEEETTLNFISLNIE